ncbi:MAG: hypothetical protein ACKO90_36785, partial [Microcystis panniformis]
MNDSGKSNREKERIVSEQIEWIDRRTEEIQSEFESESSVPTAIDINDLVRRAAKFFDLASRDIEVVIIQTKPYQS